MNRPPTNTQAEVRALLGKKPMSSGELIKALPHRHPGSIYTALSTMRNTGVIETRRGEGDADKKNFLR